MKRFQLTGVGIEVQYPTRAEVAEQADALRSGRSGHYARVGSTPTFGTRTPNHVHKKTTLSEPVEGSSSFQELGDPAGRPYYFGKLLCKGTNLAGFVVLV